jgi:Protein of unknown function (Hypoth_ymh)
MLLPSERIELAIYKFVKQLGPLPANVSVTQLSQITGESDSGRIVERLKDLEANGRLSLSKHSGGQRWPPANFNSDAAFYYRDSFLIEVAPGGRKYFEEIELRAEQEEKAVSRPVTTSQGDEIRHVIAALRLLHPAFQDYGHYFREDKLAEAIAAAFERYENRLNEIRDASKNQQVRATSGHPLIYKLFETKILNEPYPKLGSSPTAKAAYEKGLTGLMSGGVSWIRNARTHEKHNLPAPTPQEALELLFVASYLMRILDLSFR